MDKIVNAVIKYASENQITMEKLEEQIYKLKDLAVRIEYYFLHITVKCISP